MNCIVTGGSGFIGKHVASELAARGHNVTCFDTVSSSMSRTSRVVLANHDIRDLEALNKYARSADMIIHLAGILGTSELFDCPKEAIEINIIGALNVLLAALSQEKAPTVVFSTKPNHWHNVYSMTAQAVETLGHTYRAKAGLDVRILRLYNVYGPGQKVGPVRKAIPHFVTQALHDRPIEIYGNGEQLMELSYVADAAKAMTDLGLRNGRSDATLELRASDRLTVNEVVGLILKLTRSKSPVVYLPMRAGEFETEADRCLIDVRQTLKPSFSLTSLEAGMRSTVEWYRNAME